MWIIINDNISSKLKVIEKYQVTYYLKSLSVVSKMVQKRAIRV